MPRGAGSTWLLKQEPPLPWGLLMDDSHPSRATVVHRPAKEATPPTLAGSASKPAMCPCAPDPHVIPQHVLYFAAQPESAQLINTTSYQAC